MTASKGIWFVYRSHREGPLSKRVRRLQASSILSWFQAAIEEARTSLTPADVGKEALGGEVHGLGAFFEAVKEHSVHTPKTMAAVGKLLREHLHVEEGHEDDIRADEHSIRVLTSDDVVEHAYFFFDDEAVTRHHEHLAYLLLEEPRLPDGDVMGAFKPPAAVTSLTPVGTGEGATYVCLFTYYDADSLPGKAVCLPGVRIPNLAAYLRRVIPDAKPRASSADWLDTWPIEMRLLRAMIDEGDQALTPALTRAAAYPLDALARGQNHSRLAVGPQAAARAELAAAAEGLAHGGDAKKSIIYENGHAAMLCAHTSNELGFQQWILFDDRWGAAHENLASSILQYARSWDPFLPREARSRAKSPDEKAAAKADKPAPRPKSEKALAKAKIEKASKEERAWNSAVAGRTVADARGYRPAERFGEGDLLDHAKFGLGAVSRVDGGKCEVLFRDGSRLLIHGVAATLH
jgi:hypothetical protein